MRTDHARIRAVLAAIALACLAAPAGAQAVYKCTTPKGTISYQETPCLGKEAQKRVDTTHGALADEAQAREMLERDGYRGNRLSAELAREARERERREARERMEREERARRERAGETRVPEEPPEWKPPWGWAGPPGLAKPKPKPAS